MKDRTDQEPTSRRWAWRLGSLAGMAGAREELDDVLGRLPADGSAVAVFEHDQLVGLLDPEHIDELLATRGVSTGGCA